MPPAARRPPLRYTLLLAGWVYFPLSVGSLLAASFLGVVWETTTSIDPFLAAMMLSVLLVAAAWARGWFARAATVLAGLPGLAILAGVFALLVGGVGTFLAIQIGDVSLWALCGVPSVMGGLAGLLVCGSALRQTWTARQALNSASPS